MISGIFFINWFTDFFFKILVDRSKKNKKDIFIEFLVKLICIYFSDYVSFYNEYSLLISSQHVLVLYNSDITIKFQRTHVAFMNTRYSCD